MAHTLSVIFPHLVHIEKKTLNYPNSINIDDLFSNNYNLTNNYSLHIFYRELYYIPDTLEDLDGYNCTLGVAMRMVLYDSGKLRSDKITVGYRLKKVKKLIHEKFK